MLNYDIIILGENMKKKKRYRLKKGRILLAIILLIGIITLAFNTPNIINYISLKTLNYSDTSIKLIKDNDLEIKKYSKTLDNIINTKNFEKEKLEYYLEIEYQEKEKFLENINKLIEKGYNSKEINTIYNKTNNIELILNNEYNKNILPILNSNYYKEDNLERYLNYNSDNIVLDVNMYLDYEFYTHDIEIENIDSLVIVNKYYKLPKDYEPELVAINTKYAVNDRQLLTREAKFAFEEMCENAQKDDIYLYSGSAYRSYSYQNTLYNNRVYNEGLEYANKTAAKAGYSEHQTGLAIDITKSKYNYMNNYIDEEDKEFEWLEENAHKYGFILRYPKNKSDITGYAYEPWHFRYLTIEVAAELKEKNITYEEYIGMK